MQEEGGGSLVEGRLTLQSVFAAGAQNVLTDPAVEWLILTGKAQFFS